MYSLSPVVHEAEESYLCGSCLHRELGLEFEVENVSAKINTGTVNG
jgi:hypothetical protein